jgi:RND family efflux transporter MFP subunit
MSMIALAALSACNRTTEAPPPEIRPARVMTIDKLASSGTVALTGTVQAQTEINQSFRVDGRLIERTVDIGDSVRPGQLIARLDPQNEESGLQAARAQQAAARAQLVEARNNHVRMRDLVAENAVSRAQFDQAEALLKTAEAQIEAAQAQVNLAQNRLSYTRLVSDVAGVVTARGPQPGEIVSAGRMIIQVAREGARDAVFDVPAQIKDNAPLDPEVSVTLGKDAKSRSGRQADVTVSMSANPKVTAMGRVREVAPRADAVTGTFAVRVRLIDPPAAMRLGSTVTGRIKLAAVEGITIPAAALVRSEGKTAVWVVDTKANANTVSLRNITLHSSEASSVLVSGGLKTGDVIVTAGVQALRPGQKVRLLETKS